MQEKDAKDERRKTTVRLLIITTVYLYQWNDKDDMCFLLRAEQSIARYSGSIARYNIAGHSGTLHGGV